MVLDKLSDSLKETLRKVTGATFVDEKLINELVKDIQRALLQSDVNVQLVFSVAKEIKDRALKEKPPKGLSSKEHLINIVYDELVKFVGGGSSEIEMKKKPFLLMLVGLFGAGKTTSSSKIAKYYAKRGKNVLLVSTDTWRPAAADQLAQLGKQIGVDVFTDKTAKKPTDIIKKFEKEFKNYDLVIIDTAGRDALSDELTAEIKEINAAVKADETLLVINSDIGQAAKAQAEAFHENCNVTGVVITKLDGTAKGGGALTACAVTGAPVKFIGLGEKVDDFEEFKPEGFVGRLLGMGDLESLLEKAKDAFKDEDMDAMGERVLSGDFNLVDLYQQMQAMKKMGSLKKIMSMVPGMSQAQIPKGALDVQEEKLEKWKYVMDSMARGELEDPSVLSPERIERIAKGSGQPEKEIRALIKQHKQSKKMVKMMKGMDGSEKGMQKMMQKMQAKMGKKMKF
ncbi:MAG: signal recognition particle protein Srp54 [Candidatus Woesearchaeota archaeon]|nr:signal recognition particle protein Srp54 [Candidatus Woesearchaeota archaeon]